MFKVKDQSKRPRYLPATNAEVMLRALEIMRNHDRLKGLAEQIDLAIMMGHVTIKGEEDTADRGVAMIRGPAVKGP